MSASEGAMSAWIRVIKDDVAEEARQILDAILREFDLGHRDVQRIAAAHHGISDEYPHDGDEHWRARHAEIARMLRDRGVLLSVDEHHEGGPYASNADRGHWLLIQSDEGVVRNVAAALQQRPRPR